MKGDRRAERSRARERRVRVYARSSKNERVCARTRARSLGTFQLAASRVCLLC